MPKRSKEEYNAILEIARNMRITNQRMALLFEKLDEAQKERDYWKEQALYYAPISTLQDTWNAVPFVIQSSLFQAGKFVTNERAVIYNKKNGKRNRNQSKNNGHLRRPFSVIHRTALEAHSLVGKVVK